MRVASCTHLSSSSRAAPAATALAQEREPLLHSLERPSELKSAQAILCVYRLAVRRSRVATRLYAGRARKLTDDAVQAHVLQPLCFCCSRLPRSSRSSVLILYLQSEYEACPGRPSFTVAICYVLRSLSSTCGGCRKRVDCTLRCLEMTAVLVVTHLIMALRACMTYLQTFPFPLSTFVTFQYSLPTCFIGKLTPPATHCGRM